MARRYDPDVHMRTPALLSATVHLAAIAAALANFNLFSRPPIEPEPVMVEFEAIAKHAAAPKVGVQEPQPEKAKVADQTTKAPPPPSKEPPPSPPTPKPEAEAKPLPPKPEEKPKAEEPKPAEDKIALKPKEPEPPKIDKPPDPKPEPKPEVKKPDPKPLSTPPKPQPKKDTVDNILDSLLKNNDKNPPIKTPQQQPRPVKEITRQAAVAPNLASVVTASEIEGVRQKIWPCWNFTAGVKDQDTMIVTLVVQMNQDGTPVGAEISDSGRYHRDQTFRAAADAAYRAIMNPRCQPWPLSPEKYNSWRTITFNFDPRDY